MVFDIRGSMEIIEGHLAGSGHFLAGAQIGEPKAPPSADGDGLFAAVFMTSAAVVATTLSHPIESHVVTVRFYQNMLSEPEAEIEMYLANALSTFIDDLASDVDFGGEIRSLDIGGQYSPLSATWGYVDVSGVNFRIVDIALPITVDDTDAGFG